MSWEPLGASRACRKEGGAAVTIASTAGQNRIGPQICITLRLPRLPSLHFLTVRGTCETLFGRGSDAGRLRIVPGNRNILAAAGRFGAQSGSGIIRVGMPDGITPAKRPPEGVAFTHGDDWLEITLPTWAVAVERVTVPAPAAPRASVMDRVPDPAAALRGRRG